MHFTFTSIPSSGGFRSEARRARSARRREQYLGTPPKPARPVPNRAAAMGNVLKTASTDDPDRERGPSRILRRLRSGRFPRIGLVVVGLVLWPLQPAYMALITQFDPVQGANTLVDFTILNDDAGTTYDSAQIDLDLILGSVADFISANSTNPAYAGQSREDIMSSWGSNINPPPSGEVYTDWASPINGGDVDLINVGGAGTPWTDTTQNSGNQDLMWVTLVLNDSLDLNNNGVFDPATESLYVTPTQVPAFEATTTTNFQIPGNMNSYAVIPEPGTGIMMGIGAVVVGWGMYGWRKRKKVVTIKA